MLSDHNTITLFNIPYVQILDCKASLLERPGVGRTMAHLQIIVVGAGLSGIATAISCTLSGHRVTVLESAKALAEVSPNTSS